MVFMDKNTLNTVSEIEAIQGAVSEIFVEEYSIMDDDDD